MSFIAIVIAFLIASSVTGRLSPVAQVFSGWRRLVMGPSLNAKLALLLYALLPCVLLGLALWWLDSGLLNFVLSVFLLMLAFESGDAPDHVANYQRLAEAGDDEAAWQLATERLALDAQLYPKGSEAIEEGVLKGLGELYLERFFTTVFWYITFGLTGVLLVYLVRLLFVDSQSSDRRAADAERETDNDNVTDEARPLSVAAHPFYRHVQQALRWFPARLMTFTLALVGDFGRTVSVWLSKARQLDVRDRDLVNACVVESLIHSEPKNRLKEAVGLFKRAQWVWLVGLALHLIFGG